ncbi:hypothetical protein A6U91_21325 [Agrobacterium tumefaciens]|uniref:Lipoprotein n=1 Tax=Agrobacterium tumefaciens TaxID=358 RepID=A0AB36ECA4_AGRTU|nr:hypothetical protein A6U91_21325 [Agrobacterium tumefaciens]
MATTALSLALASCQTSAESVQYENDLAAAGFVARPANTPARAAMLKRLPPNKFLMRSKGNTVSYVYADPVNCNCLYVGTQKAYGAYQETKKQEQIADRQLLAAQTYRDASWDWSGWGPDFPDFYGPFGPGYGW